MDRQALFSGYTEEFLIPPEPEAGEKVCVRFRTAKGDVSGVYFRDEESNLEYPMKLQSSDCFFDYYEYRFWMPEKMLRYGFRVEKGGESCFYDRLGPRGESVVRPFMITPGFHTPAWAKGAVIYQIFVDRFCNGDRSNDVADGEYRYLGRPVKGEPDWSALPEAFDVGNFYGGDLKGVMEKLDDLQNLGVEVLYFNPLFVSPSNHKYDTQDYDHIDPHYGIIEKDGETVPSYKIRTTQPENLSASDRLFIRLVEEMHRRGMRVILDGVFNHCGSFHKWLDREKLYKGQAGYEPGAYESPESPYRSYFQFEDEGAWPDNGSYEGWWGFETLPKLNYEGSEALRREILAIGRKWVSPPYNADGWRLDVAADLGHSREFNHRFWRDFRKAVKEANPEALILAEHYGDASSWLLGDQWDTVMNYDGFMEPVSWFLTGMEKHSDARDEKRLGDGKGFFDSMGEAMSRMQAPSLLTAMNQLSNHDHSRFLTRTNGRTGRASDLGPVAAEQGIKPWVFRQAVLLQMTWPGAPALYYGDEAGLCGFTDPDNRRPYPWGREDKELLEYHRRMIRLHKNAPALRRGEFKILLAEGPVIAYGRFLKESCFVTVLNGGAEAKEAWIPVRQVGIPDGESLRRVMHTERSGCHGGVIGYRVQDGYVRLWLEGESGSLFEAETCFFSSKCLDKR